MLHLHLPFIEVNEKTIQIIVCFGHVKSMEFLFGMTTFSLFTLVIFTQKSKKGSANYNFPSKCRLKVGRLICIIINFLTSQLADFRLKWRGQLKILPSQRMENICIWSKKIRGMFKGLTFPHIEVNAKSNFHVFKYWPFWFEFIWIFYENLFNSNAIRWGFEFAENPFCVRLSDQNVW